MTKPLQQCTWAELIAMSCTIIRKSNPAGDWQIWSGEGVKRDLRFFRSWREAIEYMDRVKRRVAA